MARVLRLIGFTAALLGTACSSVTEIPPRELPKLSRVPPEAGRTVSVRSLDGTAIEVDADYRYIRVSTRDSDSHSVFRPPLIAATGNDALYIRSNGQQAQFQLEQMRPVQVVQDSPAKTWILVGSIGLGVIVATMSARAVTQQ